MKKIFGLVLLVGLGSSVACNDDDNAMTEQVITRPSDVVVERADLNEVSVSWKDNSSNEKGFAVWVMDAGNTANRRQVGTVAADTDNFSVSEGLEQGEIYYFGVQALAENEALNSRIVYSTPFTMVSMENVPMIPMTDKVQLCDGGVGVTYAMHNVDMSAVKGYGVCWSSEGQPTIEDDHQQGPSAQVDETVMQVIPAVLFDCGKTYRLRTYVTMGGKTYYGKSVEVQPAKETPAVTFKWTKKEIKGLPASIQVFETNDRLNNRPLHAFYAVADLSKGDIEFRTHVPSGARKLTDQVADFKGECLLLVNGGYFYNGRHTGLAVQDFKASGSISQVRGSLRQDNKEEYERMYYVTRGVFGVDTNGVPATYWAGSDRDGKVHFFDRPLPSVVGEALYTEITDKNPTVESVWNPRYALSAGPLLLKGGRCPFDFTTTSKGGENYMSNYEILPYDIFGKTVSPDRTAVGYTKEGRVVFFICDGRCEKSGGANLVELAQIMKGLGCVEAVNFDGGGSTGMVVCGERMEDYSPASSSGDRAVVSSLGIFVKK